MAHQDLDDAALRGVGGAPVTGPALVAATAARRLLPLADLALPDVGAAVSWWGPAEGPAGRPGSEVAVQAACGLMEVNGRDGAAPRRLGLEAASVAAGILAAQGVLAAGVAAARGRPVRGVRTSVLQAGLLLLSHYFVVATALGDAVPGPALPAPGPPFRSADGQLFEIETLDPEAWKELWARLRAGQADLGRGWTVFRWRYERAACSLPAGLHEAAGRHSFDELSEACRASGVSVMAVRGYAVPGPWQAADGLPAVRPLGGTVNGPAGGAGTTEAPLEGIRVVEATSRVQGPFTGMLLGMLGADVVRVQPPEGDYGRAAQTLHRGKATVTLDLGSPSGRTELGRLVGDADVFLHNWRPGRAEEWGLGPAELGRGHPGLVYAELSGWGDGPEVPGALGTDFLVQAATGLADGLNPEGDPAVPSRIILSDLFGGLVGAEGVLAGLCRRARQGGSWRVASSLLTGAMALQAHVVEGLSPALNGGRRQGRPVWGPLDRPLPTADGWLAVSAGDGGALRRLCSAFGIGAGGGRAAVEAAVASALGRDTAPVGAARLLEAGVPGAVVAGDLALVAADPALAVLFEPAGGGAVPRSPWEFE